MRHGSMTFRLCDFLENDRSASVKKTLARSLGDSYLYKHNHIYATLRDHVLAAGYKFSCAATPQLLRYEALPLMELQRILIEETIPYIDNISPLRCLLREDPRFRVSATFLLANLHRNFLLHETAHCVASLALINAKSSHADKDFVLDTILSEAFANAMEFIAFALASTNLEILFLSLGAYILYLPDIHLLTRELIADLEFQNLFRVVYLSYIWVNLGHTYVDETAYEQGLVEIAKTSVPTGSTRRKLRIVFDFAFKLNKLFLEVTTPMYFRAMGASHAYKQIHGRNIIKDAKIRERAQYSCERLTDLVAARRP
jgi:hypothetical protein